MLLLEYRYYNQDLLVEMNKKQRMRKAKLIAKKKNISIVKALNDLDKYNIVMEKKKRMGRSLGIMERLERDLK